MTQTNKISHQVD